MEEGSKGCPWAWSHFVFHLSACPDWLLPNLSTRCFLGVILCPRHCHSDEGIRERNTPQSLLS